MFMQKGRIFLKQNIRELTSKNAREVIILILLTLLPYLDEEIGLKTVIPSKCTLNKKYGCLSSF